MADSRLAESCLDFSGLFGITFVEGCTMFGEFEGLLRVLAVISSQVNFGSVKTSVAFIPGSRHG